MHKWQQFKYSFVYIQISPTRLILGNEASCANFNVDKRLFKSPPFMHRVYVLIKKVLIKNSVLLYVIYKRLGTD